MRTRLREHLYAAITGQDVPGRVANLPDSHRRHVGAITVLGLAATASLPAATLADSDTHKEGAIPDFSGLWSNPLWPGFEPPLSGPGPVLNKSRRSQVFDADGRRLPAATAPLVSNPSQLVGDYTNPNQSPGPPKL
jgi:hypothetical protein